MRSRDDDIDLLPDKLGDDFGRPLVASRRPAIFDSEVLAFGPAELGQPLHACRNPRAMRGLRSRRQETNDRRFGRLLPPCGQGKCHGGATDQPDEFAPSHAPLQAVTTRAAQRSILWRPFGASIWLIRS